MIIIQPNDRPKVRIPGKGIDFPKLTAELEKRIVVEEKVAVFVGTSTAELYRHRCMIFIPEYVGEGYGCYLYGRNKDYETIGKSLCEL